MQKEKLNGVDHVGATVLRASAMMEVAGAKGVYTAKCFDKNGKLKWEDTIDNVVTIVGANQLLDSAFDAGPVAGPFLGLISSVGYTTGPVAADTMASHAGWNEAGNGVNFPNWSTPTSNARKAISFDAAAARAKAIDATADFLIATNAGTVKGCFMVFGTGAVATNNNANGELLSAGVFTGGDKVLGLGDTLQVSYSIAV